MRFTIGEFANLQTSELNSLPDWNVALKLNRVRTRNVATQAPIHPNIKQARVKFDGAVLPRIAPFFVKMAQNLDLRCVLISDPGTLGAGLGPKHVSNPE